MFGLSKEVLLKSLAIAHDKAAISYNREAGLHLEGQYEMSKEQSKVTDYWANAAVTMEDWYEQYYLN